jgi:hypothetical protein
MKGWLNDQLRKDVEWNNSGIFYETSPLFIWLDLQTLIKVTSLWAKIWIIDLLNKKEYC